MDYKKKYNEALERANKYNFDGAKQVVKDLVFYIFPELKESEDERIRKEIIATIHLYYGEPLEDEAKEMIAWLEKQGDKKTTDKVDPFDKYEGLTDFERTLADICIGWIGQGLGWKQYIKDNADILLKIAIKMFNSIQDTPFEQKPTDNDMVEALRTEYEKGRADVLRCIDPDEMVADFYSQPLSKTRSLASIYRQGITDILKRINNNEETSITSTRSIDDCGL